MKFLLVSPENRLFFEKELQEFFFARYRVFVQKMGWDLKTYETYEMDQYDTPEAHYILITGYKDEVIGGMRLVSCEKPYMAEEIFKKEVWNPENLPHDSINYECSRFFIDHDALEDFLENEVRHHQVKFMDARKCIVYRMFQVLMEFGLSKNLKSFITVTEVRIERLLEIAGWKIKRLGDPFDVGYTQAVVAEMEVSPDIWLKIQKKSRWSGPLLWTQLAQKTHRAI